MGLCKRRILKNKTRRNDDRKRDTKPITRCGCMVAFRMKYNQKSNEWKAVEFA